MNLTPQGFYSAPSPGATYQRGAAGAVKTVAIAEQTGIPLGMNAFVVSTGLDDPAYVQTIVSSGTPASAYYMLFPGIVKAIAVKEPRPSSF